MDNHFAREAKIMDIVYDLDKDKLRIFTFHRNFYSIFIFKCQTIIFYLNLGSINILVLNIFGNVEKYFL